MNTSSVQNNAEWPLHLSAQFYRKNKHLVDPLSESEIAAIKEICNRPEKEQQTVLGKRKPENEEVPETSEKPVDENGTQVTKR